MLRNRINYKGMARSVSNEQIADGWVDELVNLRHKAGKLQPVGNPTKVFSFIEESGSVVVFNRAWKHDQDNISNFIGQDADYGLYLTDYESGTRTLIKAYSGVVQIEFLKRFMIVVYNGGMDTFIWKDGSYSLVQSPNTPKVDYIVNTKDVQLDPALGDGSSPPLPDTLLGKYFDSLNTQSKNNYHTGGIMIRVALRLYDGSYVLHSVPEFINLGLAMYFLPEGFLGIVGQISIEYSVSKISAVFKKSLYEDIDTDIYTHVVIFACKNEELYEVSDKYITAEAITTIEDAFPAKTNFSSIYEDVNSAFKNIVDSPAWYKVHETLISDIQDSVSTLTEVIDMSDFYQDYATREVLQVDQFSHSTIYATDTYNYNSRLLLSNVTTKFGDYKYFPLLPAEADDKAQVPTGFVFEEDFAVKLLVTLTTDSGEIKKLIDVGTRPFFRNSTDPSYPTWRIFTLANSVLGYPDSRATSITIFVQKSGVWYDIGSVKLKKSVYGNFSYYHSSSFVLDPDTADMEIIFLDKYVATANNFGMLTFATNFTTEELAGAAPETIYLTDSYIDYNRIQASEVNNPFFFPAENSYQVGTGKIISVATNTEPLSQGQFGEYPLIVFTTKGIWTLYQGTGDVLFAKVQPMNGEVAKNKEQIVSVGVGVTYTTEQGLFLISGSNVQKLTELLQGNPNTDLQAVANYTFRLNHTSLVQFTNVLSQIDAVLYMQEAQIGYDQNNKELLVTNSNYGYSYVYSFRSQYWHKINKSFRVLINVYPELYVFIENSSNEGIFNISDEDFSTPISTLITTRPLKLNTEEDFIVLHRAIQRCEIETASSMYAGFYVFGSNDLLTWQFLQGNDRKTGEITDIMLTRSHLKVKYFIFVFASTMNEKNAVNEVDVQFYSKLNNKIR